MSDPVILRVAKLKTLGHVAASGAHTWREIPTKNADALRTPMNQDLRAVRSSADLVAAVHARLKVATKQADDPVPCIEYLVTADHAAFSLYGGTVDHERYLRDALAWIEARHGRDNVVAANIQLDEYTPHLVAYVVPLHEVPGKTRKRSVIAGKNPDGTRRRETREVQEKPVTWLSAAHYIGSPGKLSQMQTDFAKKVGAAHGLRRGAQGSRATHRTVRAFYGALEQASVPGMPSIEQLRLAAADAAHAQQRVRDMAQTAIDLQKQLEPLAGIPMAEVHEAVVQHRMQRRLDQLAELVGRATGALASLCRRTFEAIAIAGDWRRLDRPRWEAIHNGVVLDSIAAGRSAVEAVEVIYEFSPGAVEANETDREDDLALVRRQDAERSPAESLQI